MEVQQKIFWMFASIPIIFWFVLFVFVIIFPLLIFGGIELKKYLDKKKKQKQILKTLETVTIKLKEERKDLEEKLKKLKELIPK